MRQMLLMQSWRVAGVLDWPPKGFGLHSIWRPIMAEDGMERIRVSINHISAWSGEEVTRVWTVWFESKVML
jgi:hypothetical protein